MLINTIKQSYRDLMGLEDTSQAIVTVPVTRTAANADTYAPSEKQARLLRRMRRADFGGQRGGIGWHVRTW